VFWGGRSQGRIPRILIKRYLGSCGRLLKFLPSASPLPAGASLSAARWGGKKGGKGQGLRGMEVVRGYG